MIAIAAVGKNWEIGKDNRLLVSIPEDMKFFRETTRGAVVVMGRKTLESFPGGRPLKGRINIVLSAGGSVSSRKEEDRTLTVVRSKAELLSEISKYNSRSVFLIGGASIYAQLIDLCEAAYITKIDKAFDADAYFPNLDRMPGWQISESSRIYENEGLMYSFVTYLHRRAA